jgi:hypothetical protein
MVRRTLTNLAALGVLAVTKPLAAAGAFRGRDAWRAAAAIGLKTEGSKFGLTAFGLDSGFLGLDVRAAARHLHRRFVDFLRTEPAACQRVVERRGCCVGVPQLAAESCYRLRAEPRPEGPARFDPPDFCAHPAGHGELVNVVCRLSRDFLTVDVWAHFHHAAVDGAPMQELMGRLEQAWGVREERVAFPTPETWRPHAAPHRRHCDGDRPLEHALDFVDFAPLLSRRQSVGGGGGGERPTVGATLIWHLAQQPGFGDKRFAATVDVPASAGRGGGGGARCVDFVVIRPADFANDCAAYAAAFNRQVAACRGRASETSRATRTLALMPPRLALAALRANPAQTAQTFGTIGLTILRDAKVFLAPMSDPGFDDGFIAVGGMDLPTAAGAAARVGAVSVKGPPGKVAPLLAAVRSAAS